MLNITAFLLKTKPYLHLSKKLQRSIEKKVVFTRFAFNLGKCYSHLLLSSG